MSTTQEQRVVFGRFGSHRFPSIRVEDLKVCLRVLVAKGRAGDADAAAQVVSYELLRAQNEPNTPENE